MGVRSIVSVIVVVVVFLTNCVRVSSAEEPPPALDKSMSDTLDVWRDGNYEQLFEMLAHRGKTSREAFVKKMRAAAIHPACCWQKMEGFKILEEKRADATVYVKIGLEGPPDIATSVTREFKLVLQDGGWRMQLSDVFSLAGVTGKKLKVKGSKQHKKKSHLHSNYVQ